MILDPRCETILAGENKLILNTPLFDSIEKCNNQMELQSLENINTTLVKIILEQSIGNTQGNEENQQKTEVKIKGLIDTGANYNLI